MQWQTKDLRAVQDNITLTDVQLSQIIGRTPDSVRGIRRYLGEMKERQDKWAEHEKGIVLENMHLTDKEIARILGRTESEVKSMRNRNGWRKKK